MPNIYYNGVAKSSNTRGVVSGLRVYCADGVVMYEDDLPHSSAYLATKAIDEAQLANIAPFGSAAELALAISSYSIRYVVGEDKLLGTYMHAARLGCFPPNSPPCLPALPT